MSKPLTVDPISQGSGFNTSVSLTIPNDVVAGDVVIWALSVSATPTMTPPPGFSNVLPPVTNGSQVAYLLYREVDDTDQGDVHTFTQSAGNQIAHASAVLRQVDSNTLLSDYASQVNASGTSPANPVVTDYLDESWPDRSTVSVLLGRGTTTGAPTATAPSGMALENGQSAAGTAKYSAWIASKEAVDSDGSVGGGNWGLSEAQVSVAITLAVVAIDEGPGEPPAGLNEDLVITDPTNEYVQHVAIEADGSDAANWLDRLIYTYKTVAGVIVRTFTLNEYGEPRVYPAKSNTVALRLFGRELPSHPTRDATVPLFQIMDDRTNRTDKFGILPDGTITKNGQPLVPLFRLPTGATWAAYAGDKSKLVGAVVLQGTTILGQWNGTAFV